MCHHLHQEDRLKVLGVQRSEPRNRPDNRNNVIVSYSVFLVSLFSCPHCFLADLSGEPLCLISSSVESGAELLKVQYFKVRSRFEGHTTLFSPSTTRQQKI